MFVVRRKAYFINVCIPTSYYIGWSRKLKDLENGQKNGTSKTSTEFIETAVYIHFLVRNSIFGVYLNSFYYFHKHFSYSDPPNLYDCYIVTKTVACYYNIVLSCILTSDWILFLIFFLAPYFRQTKGKIFSEF